MYDGESYIGINTHTSAGKKETEAGNAQTAAAYLPAASFRRTISLIQIGAYGEVQFGGVG